MSDVMTAAKCIDDLTKAGFEYDQARALVNFIVRSQEYLATKKDIRDLGRKIDRLTVKISGPRVNIDSVALDMRAEFKGLGDRLARKLFCSGSVSPERCSPLWCYFLPCPCACRAQGD